MTRNVPKRVRRTVFYAWQNDLPKKNHRYFIQDPLKRALGLITKANEAESAIEYGEATRGTAGSVMTVDSILRKIDACEVFAGDLSIISPAGRTSRRLPNPNVVFEAGWAAARLDWNRVVLVFNKASGTVENDVPFDLRGRRLLQYELRDGDVDIKARKEALVTALV